MNNMQKSFKQKAAMGIRSGMVHGKGTTTSDSVPAHLSRGEAVLPAKTVQAVGAGNVANLIQHTTGHAPGGLRAGGHYKFGMADLQTGASNLMGKAKSGLGSLVDGAKSIYSNVTAPKLSPMPESPAGGTDWGKYESSPQARGVPPRPTPAPGPSPVYESVNGEPPPMDEPAYRATGGANPAAPNAAQAAENLGGKAASGIRPTVASAGSRFGLTKTGMLAGLLEANNTYGDATTPGMTPGEVQGRVAQGAGRVAGAVAGAKFGQSLAPGLWKIPAGIVGAGIGTFAPERLAQVGAAAVGHPFELPSDTAQKLHEANAAMPDELAQGAKNQEAMAAWNARDAEAARIQAESPEGKAAAASAQLRTNQDAWLQRQGVTSAQLGGAPTTQNASNLKNQTQSGIRQDAGPAPLTTPDGIIGRRFNAEDVQAINARHGIREAQQTLTPQLLQNADTESTDRIMGSSNRADKKMNVFTGVGGGANWEQRHPDQYAAAQARQPNPSQQAAQDDMDETMAAYTAYHPKAGLALQLENRRNMLQGQSNMLQHQQMALTERHATEDRKLGIAAGTRAHDQDYQMHMATLGNTMGQQNLEQHEKAFASAFGKPKDGETDAAQPVRQALANDLASQGIPAGAMTGADVQRYIQDYKAQQAREPGSLHKIQLYLSGKPYTESASVLDKQAVAGGRGRGFLGLPGQTNQYGDFTYDPARITKDAQEEANYKYFGGGK